MVKWSLPAKLHLKHIKDYIALDSEYYAKKVVNDIKDKSKLLKDFPRLGRIVPEINHEKFRELIIYSYRLVYKIVQKDIEILAIVHSKQDFKQIT